MTLWGHWRVKKKKKKQRTTSENPLTFNLHMVFDINN